MGSTPLFELFTGRKLTGAVSSRHWFLLLLLLAPRPQCLPQFKREVLVMMVMMVMAMMTMMVVMMVMMMMAMMMMMMMLLAPRP